MHCGCTGTPLAVPQHLFEKGPQYDGRGEGCIGGEQGITLRERMLDISRRQHIGKWQAGLIEEPGGDLLKLGLVALGGSDYRIPTAMTAYAQQRNIEL